MEDTKRAKWIAVLVLVVAAGLFGRSMIGQVAADNDRSVAVGLKDSETTISTAGLYELHTHCAQVCRDEGDLSGAAWHERILAHMRGEKVDDSVNLDDAGDVEAQRAPQSLVDPTHPGRTTARADVDGVLGR